MRGFLIKKKRKTMSKKIYDLAVKTQMATEQRILKADCSGKEYNVSHVPAIINRKYYKRWAEFSQQILKKTHDIAGIQRKIEAGIVDDEDLAMVQEYKQFAEDGAQVGVDLIIATMHYNGYDEFDEDELFENFSEAGMAMAIPFIMKLEKPEEAKKKAKTRKKSS